MESKIVPSLTMAGGILSGPTQLEKAIFPPDDRFL